jgi:acetyl-CoA carboxylase carboxyltransferase component
VKQDQVKQGVKAIEEEELLKLKAKILHKYEEESSAYYSSSRIWDDGIIDPVNTRKILALCIEISLNKRYEEPKSGVIRM